MKFSTDYSQKEVHIIVVYIRAIIISLGGLFYGYNNGSFNTTQQHISNLNGWLSDSDIALYTGLITSALPLGCLIGSLISAKFLKVTHSDYRLCLMVTDIIGILGITEQIIDYSLGHFLLGRLLSGIAGGLNTSIVPSYLQNFSPIIMRGKTGTFVQTFAQLGAFISFSLGAIQPVYEKVPDQMDKATFINASIDSQETFEKDGAWRLTIGLPIIMCLIRLISLALVYQQSTPVQMAQKHQLKSLKKLLNQVYSKDRAQKRYQEILEYAKECPEEQSNKGEEEDNQQVIQEQIPQSNSSQKEEEDQNKKENPLVSPSNKDQRREFELNGIIIQNDPSLKTETQLQNDKPEQSLVTADQKPQTDRSWKKRLILGMVVQTASQASGLNALMFFSKSIFQAQTSDKDVVQMYLFIQGAAGFLFTYLSMFFIEKFGRKQILLVSTGLTLIAQLGIAIFSLFDIFIMSFISIIFFLFAFGIGLGGVTWPFIAELVNKNQVPYCSATRWIWALLIGITFRFMVLGLGIYGTFFVYLGCTGLCFLYFLKEMKETKGLSIEQVDILYAGGKVET